MITYSLFYFEIGYHGLNDSFNLRAFVYNNTFLLHLYKLGESLQHFYGCFACKKNFELSKEAKRLQQSNVEQQTYNNNKEVFLSFILSFFLSYVFLVVWKIGQFN